MESAFPDPYVDAEDEPDPRLNEITNAIIGAAIELHRQLGPGLPEPIYEESLALEFAAREIPFKCQHLIVIQYKGHDVGKCRLDFLVHDTVVLEVKAIESLGPLHSAQVLTYLRVTGFRLGLLINFNVRTLKEGIRRIAH